MIQTAENLLFTINSMTTDHSAASRHQDAAGSSRVLNLRQRAHTVRPKTTYFSEETDAPASGDHVISHPQLVPQPTKSKTVKEKKKVARSSTFRSKEKKEDKKEDVSAMYQQGNHSEENSARSEQIYIQCICALKSSLEEIMVCMFMYCGGFSIVCPV